MSLYLHTNIQSKTAIRDLNRNTSSLDLSYERLASGQRINTSKDDPAGLQISDRLTTQINGLYQGNRNAQDCLAYAQTAEGALEEITNMLQRIRVLAVQSSSDTLSPTDKEAVQVEVDQLNAEITRIAEQTTYAGADLLNGKAGIAKFQVGPSVSSVISLDLSHPFTTNGLAKIAAEISGEEFEVKGVQDPAKPGQNKKAKFVDVFSYNPNGKGIDISTTEGAQTVLAGIDALINGINRKRAEFGAIQNRVESTIRNQDNVNENVHAARSVLRDTDWATETANMTQQQILQQATASILTQANQRPQIAMNLLQK